jgi:hypothetical protein
MSVNIVIDLLFFQLFHRAAPTSSAAAAFSFSSLHWKQTFDDVVDTWYCDVESSLAQFLVTHQIGNVNKHVRCRQNSARLANRCIADLPMGTQAAESLPMGVKTANLTRSSTSQWDSVKKERPWFSQENFGFADEIQNGRLVQRTDTGTCLFTFLHEKRDISSADIKKIVSTPTVSDETWTVSNCII